jgi:DNA polymerase III alpha subunit
LGAIKGVGESLVEVLVTEREKKGHYQDMFDFCTHYTLRHRQTNHFARLNGRFVVALLALLHLDKY